MQGSSTNSTQIVHITTFNFFRNPRHQHLKKSTKLGQNQCQIDTPLKSFGRNLTFKHNVDMNRKVHRSEHINSMLLMTLKVKQGTKLNPTLMFKSCVDGKINSFFHSLQTQLDEKHYSRNSKSS